MAVIIGLNFLLAAKTRVPLYFFFFLCAVFFAVLSIVSVLWVFALSQLSLTRQHMYKIEEGENLKVTIFLRNWSFFPLVNMVIEDVISCAEDPEKKQRICVDYLPGRSTQSQEFTFFCDKRGLYHFKGFIVYFFDPIGLVYLKRKYLVNTELCVYPKTFTIRKFPQLRKGALPWFGIDTAQSTGDEDEYFGVREYISGDVVNRIHWLSTARHNKLIVKQFQRQNFYRATVLFTLEKGRDYGSGKESVAEYTIKIAASVVKYLIEHNVAVEIIAHTGEFVHIPLSKGAEQMESMFSFFAAAQAQSTIGLGEVFEDYFHYIPDDSNVIVIMLDEDWEYLMRMLPLERRNMYFVPLVLVSSTFKYMVDTPKVVHDVQVKLAGGFNCVPTFISRGDNLEEVFLKI